MMYQNIRKKIKGNLVNIPGWRTDRKIVVFESDDWGMVRMASKNAYDGFLHKGYRVDKCPYNRNDSIESNDDLELLFEVLASFKDQHNNSAVFTANNIVANPDFEKIKESNFKNYYYEPFIESLKRYPGRERVQQLYKEGINCQIFYPQFHGREHLNVNRWMAGLNEGNKILLDAFKHNMFTVHKSGNISGRRDYLDAFGMGYEQEWESMAEIVQTGLDLFEDLWGYRSLSFIAPCYIWPIQVEELLSEKDIKYLQGTHVQRMPAINGHGITQKYHYLGQKNKYRQQYLVRNVFFEPTEKGRTNAVEQAMKEIEVAFRYKKPAIISSHRVNYIGSIRTENRDKNLKLLSKLLEQIVNQYPEVEFMRSDQLGQLMSEEP